MNWKQIYSSYLKTAGELYVQERLDDLERLFVVMKSVIFDSDAVKELNEFEKNLEEKISLSLEKMNEEAKKLGDSLKRERFEEQKRAIFDLKLIELLKEHLFLAKKYGMLSE